MARFKSTTIFLLVLVAVITLAAAWRFGPLVRWYYSEEAAFYSNIQPVPTQEMNLVAIPTEWVHVNVGQLLLTLPKNLADKRHDPVDAPSFVLFEDDGLQIAVQKPSDHQRAHAAWSDMIGRLPKRSDTRLSIPHRRAEVYQSSSAEFHWSMTPAELKWHRWLMAMSIQESKSRTTAVEYVTLPTIEGLLRLEDPSTAYFEWYSLDGKTYGLLILDNKNKDELDLDWVHAVCQGVALRQP